MTSTYKPSERHEDLDSKTVFERLGMKLADLISSDSELNNQAHQYAHNKCARIGIAVDQETLDENEVYWTFVQEYTTNAIIVALGYNRTHITGPQNDTTN